MFPMSGSLGTPSSAGPLPAALSSEATGAHSVTVTVPCPPVVVSLRTSH